MKDSHINLFIRTAAHTARLGALGTAMLCSSLLSLPSPSYAQSADMQTQQTHELPKFFQYLNDIPLMDGLYESTEDVLIFEKAEGRIIKTTALSENLTSDAISGFYRSLLPQLGWTETGHNTYQRQTEKLSIQFEKDTNFTIAYFTLEPS